MGGPIKHDRTFFFAGYEGERGRPSSSLAVTGAGRKGHRRGARRERRSRTSGERFGRPASWPVPRENNPARRQLCLSVSRISSTAIISW